MFFPQGTWHCVKRQLPEGGNYDLESYLPVYLWRQECEAQGKVPFWELLRLLHKHQDVFFSSPVEIENVGCCLFLFVHNFYVFLFYYEDVPVPVKMVACIFCGGLFKGEKGVKIHLFRKIVI